MKRIDEIMNKYLISEGAHDYIAYFPGKLTTSQLEKEWSKVQAQDRDEYGSDPYNGTSSTFAKGLKFHNTKIDNLNKAADFILDTHRKWDKAIAVKTIKDKKEIWAVGGWAAE